MLYTLDTITGAATRVGTSTAFGVGETYAHGIATGYSMPGGFAIDSTTGMLSYTGSGAVPGVHTLYVQVRDGEDPAGTFDTAIDDTVRVTVTVPNRVPSFAPDAYEFSILPGIDGSVAAHPVGRDRFGR